VYPLIEKIISSFYLLFLVSCINKDNLNELKEKNINFIRATDLSSYPEIKRNNTVYYDYDGSSKDLISILKNNGVNTIRLRLWVNPVNEHSGFNEVKQFSEELKSKGLKIWLTLHYSDTWADPGQQKVPGLWENASFTEVADSVYEYTKKIVGQLKPDYIQIGNEINSGFLHPYGSIKNIDNFKALLQKGILAVREISSNTKIILHYAGTENANWFFQNVAMLDYDIIGLSYYPIWHGKSLTTLKNSMNDLSLTYNKKIVIAETAYPFTLNWNDWTNNIVGLENQLILPEYPASELGQKYFIKSIINLIHELPNNNGIGFCYWGAELVSWKGKQSTDGSVWENQALFDFNHKALPSLKEFNLK
jgi:arabinogalactan endo-1,4-beta-galactosidase